MQGICEQRTVRVFVPPFYLSKGKENLNLFRYSSPFVTYFSLLFNSQKASIETELKCESAD